MRLRFAQEHGKKGKRKGMKLASICISALLALSTVAFIAGCGESGFLGVPIYPGAEEVEATTTMMQPPAGDNGALQSEGEDSGASQSQGEESEMPQPPDGNSDMSGQPPELPDGESGNMQPPGDDSNRPQPPDGNSDMSGQPPELSDGESGNMQPPGDQSGTQGQPPELPDGESGTMQPPGEDSGMQMPGQTQGESATFLTSDSMDKVVKWYEEQLSGKDDYNKQEMQQPGRTQTSDDTAQQEEDSDEDMEESQDMGEAPVIISFTSGDSTRTVMISENSGDEGGTYITISGSSQDGSSESSESADIKATYTVDGGSETLSGETFEATETDTSAVLVTNSGSLTLSDSEITTSGDTSSNDQSSFEGLNAAVLVNDGGTLKLSDTTIKTSGTGANGVFSYGSESLVELDSVTIKATNQGGHAIMATGEGTLTANNVTMETAGTNSGAIATDRGSGTIDVTGGSVLTTGQDSPAVYSTGDITVTGTEMECTGSEGAVIEGSNTITLNDCSLVSSLEDKWGVLLYQSMSGDAEGVKGVFTMTGGSLAYTSASGPLFYVTNSEGTITLKGVEVNAGSGVLLQAAAGKWGTSGSNGGTANFTADEQALTGNLIADNISTINATLQNGSSLSGAINADNAAQAVNLTLDATSTWNVTADSYLTTLTNSEGISGTTITNITGNGHTVYYDSAACTALGGATYTLAGGGTLTPK